MAGEPLRVLAVATANAHKLEEIRAILAPFGFDCHGLDHWPDLPDIPEDAPTFEENALHKARVLFAHCGLPTLADDSGLEVDALGGAPGVHSKRFTPEATAATNNARLLHLLQDVPARNARFRCVVAAVGPAGEAFASGTCEGAIGHAARGTGGFGYDPLFLPDEAPGRTLAELSADEKNRISHRGRAFRHVPDLLARVT